MIISSGGLSARSNTSKGRRHESPRPQLQSKGSIISETTEWLNHGQIMKQLWVMEAKLTNLEVQMRGLSSSSTSSTTRLTQKLDDIGSRFGIPSQSPSPATLSRSKSKLDHPDECNGLACKNSMFILPQIKEFSGDSSTDTGRNANYVQPPASLAPAAPPAFAAGSLPLPQEGLHFQQNIPCPLGDMPLTERLAHEPEAVASGQAIKEEPDVDEMSATKKSQSSPSPGDARRKSALASIEDLKAMTDNHAGWRVQLWATMDDPESGWWGKHYAMWVPYLILASVTFAMLQTSSPPMLQGASAILCNVLFETFFLAEFSLRAISCPTKKAFLKDFNNIIDCVVTLPLFIRVALGFRAMEGDQCGSICVALMCFVPFLRTLKILRRFESLPLLFDALGKAAEGLPVCLFVLFTMIIFFAPLIYLLEPRDNIESIPMAMWLTIVTMTTVGYGDITPSTTMGSVLVSFLVVLSVMYMAVPLGIVGNAFTEVWQERDFILLRYRTQAKFAQWGFTAHDIPALFEMFAEGEDGGELELHAFSRMMSEMRIGLSERRVEQLFDALDEDNGGSIDDREFVKKVFPEAYHTIYDHHHDES